MRQDKTNSSPLLLLIAGNMSILPFYFRNNGPVLITNESLVAELELTSQGRIWEIRISGEKKTCEALQCFCKGVSWFDTSIICLMHVPYMLALKVPRQRSTPQSQ
jgi:hypothetical protein